MNYFDILLAKKLNGDGSGGGEGGSDIKIIKLVYRNSRFEFEDNNITLQTLYNYLNANVPIMLFVMSPDTVSFGLYLSSMFTDVSGYGKLMQWSKCYISQDNAHVYVRSFYAYYSTSTAEFNYLDLNTIQIK